MEEQRTAFKVFAVIDRRQQIAQGGPIRSVAVDAGGRRLYLGLEDGLLEEHTLVAESGAANASLSARKHVSKRSITAVLHLGPAANCLAVLTDDGSAQLLDCESLKAQPLPFRNVVAACVDARPGWPARLALAMRPSKRVVRVEVHEVPVQGMGQAWGRRPPLAQAEVPDGSAVKGMAWVGPHIVLCTGLKYVLVAPGQQGGQWRELFAVPEDLAYSPAMVQPIPQRGQAVLVVGPAGIVIDATGSPVGSALRLEGLATPRALAASAGFVLAACEDAIHVFDCTDGGGEVQLLQYGPGLRPSPGQPMYAADNLSGSCVVVAGRQVVWACLPVSLEEQAREVLRRREYGKALEVIERGLQQGEGWAELASAQAALCMLHECMFEEAAEALERCSPAAFQPSELFPLFPEHTQPWLGQVPASKRYWGLCPQLQSLSSLISRWLARQSAASSPRSEAGGEGWANGSQQSSSMWNSSPPTSSSGRVGAAQQQQQQQAHRKVPHMQQQQQQSSEGEEGGGEAEQLRRRALQSLAQYLFRVRMLEGVLCLEGVDTLLLLMLVDLRAVRQVAAFAAVPNNADAQAVAARLQALGWHHALATLWAARGDAESALRIWQQLVEGSLPVGEGGAQEAEVQAAERREALESAAALLRDPRTASEATVLAALPWLLPASPPTALAVLAARPLDPRAVLGVLPRDSEVRWQYLDHLVACMAALEAAGSGRGASAGGVGAVERGSSQPASRSGSRPGSAQLQQQQQEQQRRRQPPAVSAELARALQGLSPQARGLVHTELATQLVAAILRLQPELRSPEGPAQRRPPPRLLGSLARVASQGLGCTTPTGEAGGSGCGTGGSRRGSAYSTAALVSREATEEGEGAAGKGQQGPALRLRLRLRQHLEESAEYDRAAVLGVMAGTGLHEELVVLHSQMGSHMAALRLLALTLRDIAAAEAYAITHLPPAEYRALLQLVLHPGPGIEPLYDDATYLVTALGEHLDAMDVVATLPPSMPLAAAAAIVAPLLRDRMHRRRQGAVSKNLQRARLTAVRGERCDAETARVVVDEERACPGCHLRIGGKVFVVLQGGASGGGEGPGGAGEGPAAQGAAAGGGAPRQGPLARLQAQQPAATGRELRVVCYNCWKRAGAKAGGQPSSSQTYSGSLDPVP